MYVVRITILIYLTRQKNRFNKMTTFLFLLNRDIIFKTISTENTIIFSSYTQILLYFFEKWTY